MDFRDSEIQSNVIMRCSSQEELKKSLFSSFTFSNLLFMF